MSDSSYHRIDYATNCWRRIVFSGTTFSFKLIEKGGLGEEFIETIRSFKKELDPILSELGLPRLVRVLVSDILTLDSGAYGIYVHSDAEPYFNIQIDIEQLREFELSIVTEPYEAKLVMGMLNLFLHECVHFTTLGEKKTQKITLRLIRLIPKDIDIEKKRELIKNAIAKKDTGG